MKKLSKEAKELYSLELNKMLKRFGVILNVLLNDNPELEDEKERPVGFINVNNNKD